GLLTALLHAQSGRLTLDDVSKLVRLNSIDMAPDGKSVAVVVSRANYEDNRFDTQLVVVDADSGKQRPLTYDRRAITSPRWSPTGDRIAFLAEVPPAAGTPGPPAPPKSQLFVLPMNGGDAQQVTKAGGGVSRFAWKPDGSALAYVATDEAEKKTGPERHNGSFEVGNDSILTQAPPMPKHIWLVPVAGGSPKRLTSGKWSVGTSDLSWSPDGKLIA